MWPFRRRETPASQPEDPQGFSFSQVDTTERFGDNVSLAADEWVATTPLNSGIANPETAGLPPVGASDDDVYSVASRLSRIRDAIQIADDGVYCPICHIANTDLARLHTPCPRCGRALLRFGWD